jgi:hypothetical protein
MLGFMDIPPYIWYIRVEGIPPPKLKTINVMKKMTRKEFLKLIVKNPLLLFTKTSRLTINEL